MNTENKKTIGVVMIVKNEKDHLRKCLESVKDADVIYIADTGSEDDTVVIAKEFTENVFTDYVWKDDFADARNFIRQKAETDWCLSIDADEILEVGGMDKIREIIENAQDADLHFSVRMTAQGNGFVHDLPRIFKNTEEVKWLGIAHETLSPFQKNLTDIVIEYGSSTAHALDENRMQRILKKIVESDECAPRDLYYYAREFYYRRDYVKAAELFEEYVLVSKWIPEKADGLLYLSRCYFYSGKGDMARSTCLKAIEQNPDFKEALIFMSEIHFEPWKHKWEKLASVATNEDVLFKRQ